MKRYLLDTCTVSDFFSGIGETQQRLRETSPLQIAVSAVTTMEILYGFNLNRSVKRRFSKAFQSLCGSIEILPFDKEVATVAAEIRSHLKAAGTPISAWDLLIGATAFANDCVLVTANVREFERINGLTVQNWR